MPDYKKMYLNLAQETEKAIRLLIDAQKICEELYLSEPDAELVLFSPEDKENTDET